MGHSNGWSMEYLIEIGSLRPLEYLDLSNVGDVKKWTFLDGVHRKFRLVVADFRSRYWDDSTKKNAYLDLCDAHVQFYGFFLNRDDGTSSWSNGSV